MHSFNDIITIYLIIFDIAKLPQLSMLQETWLCIVRWKNDSASAGFEFLAAMFKRMPVTEPVRAGSVG